jgi:hypothetical protein
LITQILYDEEYKLLSSSLCIFLHSLLHSIAKRMLPPPSQNTVGVCKQITLLIRYYINPLNAELNPICHLLALLVAHHILHVSRITVNSRLVTPT